MLTQLGGYIFQMAIGQHDELLKA